MKKSNPGKLKMSSGSPTQGGTKAVPVAKPKSAKSANNTANKTAKIIKR